MDSLAGPLFVAALVVGFAGTAKVFRPLAAATALSTAGLPSSPWLVRALGTAEVAVAGAVLTTAIPVAALALAGTYAAFSVFLGWLSWRSIDLASCGCFGRADTPPSAAHMVFNVLAVATSLAWAISPGRTPAELIAEQPLAGIPFVGLVALGTLAAIALLTVLPQTAHAARRSMALRGPRAVGATPLALTDKPS